MTDPLPIVVAVDGSSESDHAVDEAATISHRVNVPLVVLTVVPPPTVILGGPTPAGDWYEKLAEEYQHTLDRGAVAAKKAGATSVRTERLEGPVVDTLVRYLESHPTRLAVVGARGRSGISRFLLGSVSEGLVHHAPCSVLVVRPPASPAKGEAGATSHRR